MSPRLVSTAALLALLACGPAPEAERVRAEAMEEGPRPRPGRAEVTGALRATLAEEVELPLPQPTRAEMEALTRFYGGAAEGPLWVDAMGRPEAVARELLGLLDTVELDGLPPGDYAAGRLDSLLDAVRHLPTAGDVARLDVGLSLAAYRYFRHLHVGRVDPRRIGFRLGDPGEQHDVVALLRDAIAQGALRPAVAVLRSPLPEYRRARAALARYRAIADRWPAESLPIPDPLRPGESSGGLAGLWRRLELVGDVRGTRSPGDSTYAGNIVDGVKRFQARHGLHADGVIGAATLTELRVPVRQRAHQLELLLERLRWLPDLSVNRLVMVNIPMFELSAWDDVHDSTPAAVQTAVIVGRALATETPVLVADLRHVILRPYWNVPLSIVRGEIVPAVRGDPDYLAKNRMEIVEGQSEDARPVEGTLENLQRVLSGRGLRVRQRPGPWNALGLVKFVFPNDLDVYLHGTPAPALFSRSRRDFSHGCVRVEDPIALAAWVLRDRPDWDRNRIVEAMERGPDNRRVDLPRPLRVILFYTTASVAPDGTVRFARDIYQYDPRLEAALHAALAP